MKLSILTAAIILLCPFACIAHDTAKSSSALQITKKSENKCLIPGYKVTYNSTINGHDLGVITRIVKKNLNLIIK